MSSDLPARLPHDPPATGAQVEKEPRILAVVAGLDEIAHAHFVKFARLLRFGQHLGRQRVGDARIGAAAIVVDGGQAGQGGGVEAFDGDAVMAVERIVEGLDQQQVAVAVDGQTGPVFRCCR